LNALLVPPGAPDAALLRRYLDDHDDAAFELLVRRHAAAVWRVCRAVAFDHHAAEDAFQVTFLALARKAAGIRTPVLAGWLCRVANRAALKTRRRWTAALAVEPAISPDEPDDTAAVLHAELDKLPDDERLPVVLCHLSGYTQAQAAAALGLPLGTVAARISRACGKLRDRLTRRGVTLSVAGATTALGTATAGESLVLRVLALGQPDALVPPLLTALAREVTSAMRPTLLRTLVLSGLVAFAVAGAVFVPVAADDPKPVAKKPAEPDRPKVAEADLKAKLELIHAKHHLKKVAEAYMQYVHLHGKVPTDVTDGNGKALLSWRVHLLPYMDQRNVHSLIQFDKAWDHPDHDLVAKILIKTFISVVPGPPYVHNNHKYIGTRVRRISGPTGMNTEFATTPEKFDFDARQANFGRFRETDYPVIIEAGIPTPWLKPDEDYVFDPKAKKVKLLGAHEAGTLVATVNGEVKLLQSEPDAVTFTLWLASGAKAEIDPTKLDTPAAKLTEADNAAAEWIRREWQDLMEAKLKLERRRLELRRELLESSTFAGDPDPLRVSRFLDGSHSLRNDSATESEVRQLEAELKRRGKK
jgi:RNA polymerase sigma factor (sigma-70 family)